jgi:magnesium and cobalt exporter, CNNM family
LISQALSRTLIAERMSLFSIILKLAGVFAIVALNGFFVAAEFAIVKVRSTQIEPLVREGSKRARVAQHVLNHLDVYLSSCQLGVTMTSLGLGWVGEPFVADLLLPAFQMFGADSAFLHTVAFLLAFSLITFLHIVLGEQAPKWLAIQNARRTALAVSGPLELFTSAFRPFIWLLNSSVLALLRLLGISTKNEGDVAQSEEELRLLLSRGKALTSTGKSISLRAIELRDRTVREVMVPRTAIVYLSTDRTIEENIARAIENQFTRYPLCEKNVDNILGMVHIKDLFKVQGEKGSGARLLEVKREMPFVPETTSLEKILNMFLSKRLLMAIAVDEYGGTAGLVTLENVLEELVGEIRDEFDVEPIPVQKVSDNEFLVDGTMALHDFGRMFDIEPGSRDVVTVSGYVFQLLGKVPEKGAAVPIGHWLGTIEAVERRKVKTLRLTRVPEQVPSAQPKPTPRRRKKG